MAYPTATPNADLALAVLQAVVARAARAEALSSVHVSRGHAAERTELLEEGHSVEEELELFLSRDGRYAGDWVPLQKASRQLFVRYEQIVLVSPMG